MEKASLKNEACLKKSILIADMYFIMNIILISIILYHSH